MAGVGHLAGRGTLSERIMGAAVYYGSSLAGHGEVAYWEFVR